jgi:hypothetical protein
MAIATFELTLDDSFKLLILMLAVVFRAAADHKEKAKRD